MVFATYIFLDKPEKQIDEIVVRNFKIENNMFSSKWLSEIEIKLDWQ